MSTKQISGKIGYRSKQGIFNRGNSNDWSVIEEIVNILRQQENENYHYVNKSTYTHGNDKENQTSDRSSWWGTGVSGALSHSYCEHKLVYSLLKSV